MGRRDTSGDYERRTSEKAAVEKLSSALLKETYAILNRERVFPKRVRRQHEPYIIQAVQLYHTYVAVAQGVRVENHGLFADRYNFQTLAIAWLYALNVKMTAAKECLDAPAEAFTHWGDLYDAARDATYAWRNKNKKDYESRFGSLTADELREPVVLNLGVF